MIERALIHISPVEKRWKDISYFRGHKSVWGMVTILRGNLVKANMVLTGSQTKMTTHVRPCPEFPTFLPTNLNTCAHCGIWHIHYFKVQLKKESLLSIWNQKEKQPCHLHVQDLFDSPTSTTTSFCFLSYRWETSKPRQFLFNPFWTAATFG